MSDERKQHFSMVRSFVLADLFTFGNVVCGMGAILVCLRALASGSVDDAKAAFWLLPAALVCDALDGRIARWRQKSSMLGADLDSLADIVSFGVAPAVLGYVMGLRGAIDEVILIFFVACGISRLARFNVTASALADETGKVRYFEGTPIPTSLLLVLLLGLQLHSGATLDRLWGGVTRIGDLRFHPFSLGYAALGATMVSATLRIPKL